MSEDFSAVVSVDGTEADRLGGRHFHVSTDVFTSVHDVSHMAETLAWHTMDV